MRTSLSRRRWATCIGVLMLVVAGGLLLGRRGGGGGSHAGAPPTSASGGSAPTARFGRIRPRQTAGNKKPTVPDEIKRSIQAHGDELLACGRDGWCPPGSMCNSLPDGSGVGCYSSTCKSMSDESCGPGRSCMLLDASPVYRCAPAGSQGLGAVCSDDYPGPRNRVCEAGLVCWNGKCRAQCSSTRACAGGGRCIAVSQRDFVCAEDSCESDSDCGAGHLCYAPPIDDFDKSKTCIKVAKLLDGTQGCTPGSCPRGYACDAALVNGEFRGQCRKVCSEVPAEPCPNGFVCGAAGIQGVSDAPSACYRVCEFYTADQQCGTDEACATISEEMSHSRTGCRWKIVDFHPAEMVGLTGVFVDPTPPQHR